MTRIRAIWGENIRRARLAVPLTQVELAEKVDATQQAIAKWEAGKSAPRDAARWKLAKVLGVPVHELFAFPDNGDTEAA